MAAAVKREWSSARSALNGLGSTGSRLLTGNTPYVQYLEDRIAHFHGYVAGVLFNCGYMANVGLLSTVANHKSTIIFDVAVHASTHDGIRLSRTKALPFKHNDLNHLETRLKHCTTLHDRFICIESIYSTDGSTAPLPEICQLASKYEAHLIVDEAHAVGICGPRGRDLVAEQNLTSQVFAQINTFGKALGTYGAIVLGNNTVKQALINFANSFIYTTALPFHALAAIKCSYDLFPKLEDERKHLRKLIQMFRNEYSDSSATHIQAIPFKGNGIVKHMAKKIAEQGFDARPLLSPTVQRGQEVLRVCLHAFNTEEELTMLLKSIELNEGSHDVSYHCCRIGS